jgi:hypothetical protein
MASVAQLNQALRAIIAGQRLGQPVFVRCLIQGSATEEELEAFLVQAADLIGDWLNQPLQRLYALGSSQSGEVSLSLHFDGGATALVSYDQCLRQDEDIDLMVVGNRGAAYHHGSFGNSFHEGSSFFPKVENLPAELTPILGLLKRSLRSGKPESVPAEPAS